MKYFFISLLCLCGWLPIQADTLCVRIDPRIELTDIAFRLAGIEEYCDGRVDAYNRDIDTYFHPYLDHPLINYIREIRLQREIAYDAIASSAFLLLIEDDSVRLNPTVDIKEYLAEVGRWDTATLHKYVDLLDDFYRTSRFDTFFNTHGEFYARTVEANRPLFGQVNMAWFESFYGHHIEGITAYIALGNGPHHYALPKCFAGEKGILIGPTTQYDGIPLVPETVYPTVIHEICHYYTNPLAYNTYNSLHTVADSLYTHVSTRLARVGYGSSFAMFGEWLNELCANMYLKQNAPELLPYNVARDEDIGFIWMGRSVAFMDNFFANRTCYPHFHAFLPQIIAFFNRLPEVMNQVSVEFDNRTPYIVDTYPVMRSSVSPDIDEIRVIFSRPMLQSSGFRILEGSLTYDATRIYWSDNNRILHIPIANLQSPIYRIEFIDYSYVGANGHRMQQPFLLMFNVKL